MLEHLIDFEPEVSDNSHGFVSLEKSTPSQTVDAKVNTLDWLQQLGAVDTDTKADELDTQHARKAFANLVSATPDEITHTSLAQVKTPQAVRHLVTMLTAYDWEFVERAKELRGYTVAKILEECENPSASIRLKALALLGKVTEVGLFTDKIEVKKTEMSDAEIDSKIKEKLNRFMGVVDVTDVGDVLETQRLNA
jgi:broad-specificity NMP kinase